MRVTRELVLSIIVQERCNLKIKEQISGTRTQQTKLTLPGLYMEYLGLYLDCTREFYTVHALSILELLK